MDLIFNTFWSNKKWFVTRYSMLLAQIKTLKIFKQFEVVTMQITHTLALNLSLEKCEKNRYFFPILKYI